MFVRILFALLAFSAVPTTVAAGGSYDASWQFAAAHPVIRVSPADLGGSCRSVHPDYACVQYVVPGTVVFVQLPEDEWLKFPADKPRYYYFSNPQKRTRAAERPRYWLNGQKPAVTTVQRSIAGGCVVTLTTKGCARVEVLIEPSSRRDRQRAKDNRRNRQGQWSRERGSGCGLYMGKPRRNCP